MKSALIASLMTGVLASGCQTVETTQEGMVGVDRTQHMLVSAEEVNESAAQAYHAVLAKAAAQHTLDTDSAALARVRGIVRRLIPATAAFRTDAPGWPWEVHVLSSAEVNAWCMPGGRIAVYTGLMAKLHPSDAELAAVQQALEQLGIATLGMMTDVNTNLAQNIADLTIVLPHSRRQETEADRIGVGLMARAGYDPHAAVSLWEKMAGLGESQPPQFLSTHPSPETRLADLRAYAAKVMPLYQAARQAPAAAGR
jgi:predicted Zn-dependent protease